MSNYCDFNPRLFKEFISKKIKIKPEFADDWEIIPHNYNTLGGFSLKSKNINQEVADIDLRRFLTFSKDQNLIIEGLKLKGSFIIGNNRSIYTEEMYQTWKDKFEERTSTLIEKNDRIPGHKYKTPCGMSIVYLGYRYVSNIKESDINCGKYNEYTKIMRIDYGTEDCVKPDIMKANIHKLSNKFNEDLGEFLSSDEVDKVLNNYYQQNVNIVCFEKEKPKDSKNIKYEIIEIKLPKKYSKDYKTLLCKHRDELWASGVKYFSEMRVYYYNPLMQDTTDTTDTTDIDSSFGSFYIKFLNTFKDKEEGFYCTAHNILNQNTMTKPSVYIRDSLYYKIDSLHRIGIIK